jgi:hypothetical protein
MRGASAAARPAPGHTRRRAGGRRGRVGEDFKGGDDRGRRAARGAARAAQRQRARRFWCARGRGERGGAALTRPAGRPFGRPGGRRSQQARRGAGRPAGAPAGPRASMAVRRVAARPAGGPARRSGRGGSACCGRALPSRVGRADVERPGAGVRFWDGDLGPGKREKRQGSVRRERAPWVTSAARRLGAQCGGSSRWGRCQSGAGGDPGSGWARGWRGRGGRGLEGGRGRALSKAAPALATPASARRDETAREGKARPSDAPRAAVPLEVGRLAPGRGAPGGGARRDAVEAGRDEMGRRRRAGRLNGGAPRRARAGGAQGYKGAGRGPRGARSKVCGRLGAGRAQGVGTGSGGGEAALGSL